MDTLVVLKIELSDKFSPSYLIDVWRECVQVCPCGGEEGIVLSGNVPPWIYATLMQIYNGRPYIAIMDDNLGGAVIVESNKVLQVGTVIPIPKSADIRIVRV